MTKVGILSVGFIARHADDTCDGAGGNPGARRIRFYYPNTHYMTGGYGVRATPGPHYYYWNEARGYPTDYYPG